MNNLPPLLYFGGSTYQTFSYASAFAFGLNFYFYSSKKYYGFGLSSKILFYFVTLVTLLGVVLSGGRGGVVLIAAYLFYFSFVILKHIKKKFFFFIFEIIFLLFVLILFRPVILINITEIGSFNRLFEYIGSDFSIDWGGTSGRDEVYLKAIEYINLNPVFGYGVFGIFNITGYPHNFFLEILLSGGITFLIFFIIIALVFILPVTLKLIKNNSIIVVIAIYPLVQLFFSGSYLTNSEFWFVLSFILSSYFIYGKKSTPLSF
jgi:O-antigen ligase